MEKKKYDLQFRYADNDQLYNDNLELTEDEAGVLNAALAVLANRGDITSPDGDSSITSMLVEYNEPGFDTFEQLRQRWNGEFLGTALENAGFNWETGKSEEDEEDV